MSLGRLTIDLGANIANFVSDMGRAARVTEQQTGAMQREAARVREQWAQTGRAVAAAATVVAGALTLIVSTSIDAADNIRDLSLKTGISTVALSEYESVAKKTGTTVEAFAAGVNKMQRSLIEAAEGGAKQTEAFEKLGLSVFDLLKLEPDKQFEAIADKISQFGNAAEKTAVSQAIFGKGAAALAPLMAEGAAGIEAARAKATAFGTTIGREFANNADLFNDNMVDIRDVTKGLGRQFTDALLPALIEAQQGFLGMTGGVDFARQAGEKIGSVIVAVVDNLDTLILAFKTLAGLAVAVKVAEIASSFTALASSVSLVGGPLGLAVITVGGLVTALDKMFGENKKLVGVTRDLENATRSVTDAWLKQAEVIELVMQRDKLRQKFIEAEIQAETIRQQLAEKSFLSGKTLAERAALGYSSETGELAKLTAQLRKATDAQDEALASITKINKAIADLKGGGSAGITGLSEVVVTAKRKFSDWDKTIGAMNDGAFEDLLKLVDEFEKEQEEYNQSLQDFIDIGDPVGALVREFTRQLEFANKALQAGHISAEQYQASLNALSDGLGKAAAGLIEVAEESDRMREAMLEGVRIIERSFQDMWESILSGESDVFDGLLDGFKSMLARMRHEASTQKIIMQIETAVNGGKMDLKQLGEGIAALAGQIVGAKLGGGGEYANTGAALGGMVGSIWGPIGTAIGSVLGGLVGGLFDSDRPLVLEMAGFNIAGKSKSDTDSSFETIFGTQFLRSRRLDAGILAQYKESIKQFDLSIASLFDDSQIAAAADRLKTWSNQIEGETLTLEELLGSRLSAIISTLTADVRGFVDEATDLAERVTRLQVAMNADALMKQMPEVFEGRTLTQFLSMVEAFQNGTETIVDAFNEVLQLLVAVKAATDVLADFAGSNPAADFEAMMLAQSRTVAQQLIDSYSELGMAIATSDRSVESVQHIASLVAGVREGEIRYLTQLDALQKGMNANLDQLRAEVLGLTALPKTGADLFNDARGMVAQILQATSAEDAAGIEQQFLGLIRAISPEDQITMQASILQLIDSFQRAANDVYGDFRAKGFDNAVNSRDQVETFLAEVGGPLEIIAATNERAAAALELLASDQAQVPAAYVPPPAMSEEETGVVDSIIAANAQAADEQNRILEEGMHELSRTMADGSSFTAATLANAIRNGDFRFTLVVKASDLNTR